MTVLGKHWLSSSVFDKNPDADGKAIRKLTGSKNCGLSRCGTPSWPPHTRRAAVTILPAGSGLIDITREVTHPSLTDRSDDSREEFGWAQSAVIPTPVREPENSHRFADFAWSQCALAIRLSSILRTRDSRLEELRELRLCHMSMDGSAQSLAHSPATANLRLLDLLNNPIGDAGLHNLLASPGLRKLEALSLTTRRLTRDSLHARSRSGKDWQTVRSLHLQDNPITPERQNPQREPSHARNSPAARQRQMVPSSGSAPALHSATFQFFTSLSLSVFEVCASVL